DLSAPNAGILLGFQAKYRPGPRLALGASYQLDVRGDRSSAYSELGVADGVLRIGRGSVEGSLEVDLAGRIVNHARMTIRSAPIRNTSLFVEARRYHPYFELWTIWGAFSPVGFNEAKAGLTWASRDGRLLARGETSYRNYGNAETDAPDDFREDGWGLGGSVHWVPVADWRTEAGYRVEGGFGAARWDGQLALRHDVGAGTISLNAVGFQRLYEFRLGEGTVVGLGADAIMPVGDRGRVFASLMAYRQHGGIATAMDWNQRRASLRLEWTLGREPVARTPGGAP
ncbi:MAG TPA: hypothetical protein VFZ73_13315, partial [Gemmatimonadaceae bacterium]